MTGPRIDSVTDVSAYMRGISANNLETLLCTHSLQEKSTYVSIAFAASSILTKNVSTSGTKTS